MADLSKVKIGSSLYDIKDDTARTAAAAASAAAAAASAAAAAEETRAKAAEATLQTNIDNEASTRATKDAALETRIENLEARGRFLSSWSATTGLPGDYPTIPAGSTSPYTYTFKTGDYYLVSTVPASGTKYRPDGISITATWTTTPEEATWEVGKAEETAEVSVGDEYIYSTSGWILIHTAQKQTTWGSIGGTLSEQTDLQTALDAKLSEEATVAGVKFGTDEAITKEELQTALELDAMAYAATATGTVAGQTISGVKATGTSTGSIDVTLTQTSTAASLTKGNFTPSGSITGSAIAGGSIAVTVKDAATGTDITNLTYESYTPAGTIAAVAETGSFSAIKTATFGEDSENGVQIAGTVSKPAVTITAGTEKTFATGLTGGSVASFTEGAFTAASYDAGFLSTGTQASFTQGAKASLTAQTKSAFATEGITAHMATGEEIEGEVTAETLILGVASTSDAVTDRGTFTANGDDSFTANTLQTLDSTKFHGGSKAADTFTANTLQSVETDKVHDTPTAELAATPTFTGNKYKITTTADTALKEVAFTGTAADVKLTGAKYLKQEIDTATFTGTAATLGFSGTEAQNVLVTGVNYDKATVDEATFTGAALELTVGDIAVQQKSVTVSPDAE